MKRKLRRGCLMALVWTAILLLMLEGLLWAFDPLGVHYMVDIGEMFRRSTDSPRGYAYAPGMYEFRDWSATITDAQTRLVPDTPAHADCTIVFLGDSVTFGRGVEDSETWANLIAREFPDVRFINTGTDGYNTENVLLAMRDVPADGYVWLVVGNDRETAFTPNRKKPPFSTWISKYLIWWHERDRQSGQDAALATEPLPAAENLILIAYDAPLWGITDYVHTEQVLGVADPHPDAQGHREIAEQLTPYVAELMNRVCK